MCSSGSFRCVALSASCHLCHVWSGSRSSRPCDGQKQANTNSSWMSSVTVGLSLVWAWCTAGWVHPTCACAYLSRSAGGWPEHFTLGDRLHLWCSLTVILVPSFHQKARCVRVGSHLTWYHLSLQHACRQLCIQTASAAHTFKHSYASNFSEGSSIPLPCIWIEIEFAFKP